MRTFINWDETGYLPPDWLDYPYHLVEEFSHLQREVAALRLERKAQEKE